MSSTPGTAPRLHLRWVDLIKGAAMLWIMLNHLTERLFGCPYIANPSPDWPPLAERIQQLAPLSGFGALDPVLNLARYVGWSGDQGVQLFLIASGFGLTWGYLGRYGTTDLPLGEFYRRRLLRILPLWWGAHVVVMVAGYLLGSAEMTPLDPRFYLSLLGLRFHPQLLYYGSAAWWYVGLLIQLYLVYPLLWRALQRVGPGRLLVVACLLSFAARSWGLIAPGAWMDSWLRGILFVTRLPEFLFGMSLAVWMFRKPEAIHAALRSPAIILAAFMTYGIATVVSLTLPGMIFAPAMLGMAAFVLLYALFTSNIFEGREHLRWLAWVGVHSYSLYLLHDIFIEALVADSLDGIPLFRIGIGILAAICSTFVAAVLLERTVTTTIDTVAAAHDRRGLMGAFAIVLIILFALGSSLVAAEALVRSQDPQEVVGWGERPSLVTHEDLGWRLRPGSDTHLRWEGYDYRVQANALGFPGSPDSFEDEDAALKIMTLGDAFTSGEGVGTHRAWPPLLQSQLEQRLDGRSVLVSNFAVTGYGPNQYLEALRNYGRRVQPDLILIGLFVNDFLDVLVSNDDFQKDIGFGRPDPASPSQWVRLVHVRKWLQLQLVSPLHSWLNAEPEPRGWYLANLSAFDLEDRQYATDGALAIDRRMGTIALEADDLGCPVLVLLVPAPIEIMPTDQLDYFPNDVDLNDSSRFDLERPKTMGHALVHKIGFGCYDLREPLVAAARADETAPLYFSFNMHWTERAHAIVADYVAGILIEDGWLVSNP